MTEFTETRGGLVIPKPKPEPPRQPLEFDGEEQRDEIKAALAHLWQAMGLGCGGGIVLPTAPSRDARETYKRIWQMLGEMALGDERPEMEEYT